MRIFVTTLGMSLIFFFAIGIMSFIHFEECRYQAICEGVQRLNSYKTSFPPILEVSLNKPCKGFNYYLNKEKFYYIDEHFSSKTSVYFKNKGKLHP